MKVIYDIGSNNGDDIPYYLKRADKVVAIEANPALCYLIRERFAKEIKEGKVVVISCVVTAEKGLGEVDFYLHNSNNVLGQMPQPAPEDLHNFTRIKLPSKGILGIIEAHGEPFYIKIDIEHYDVPLLKALFAEGIRPPYMSAEAHSPEVLELLTDEGHYRAFKLVDGYTIEKVYANRLIDGELYSFPAHSAGPFGGDIDGDWIAQKPFQKLLAKVGRGWKDIHVTNRAVPIRSRGVIGDWLNGLKV